MIGLVCNTLVYIFLYFLGDGYISKVEQFIFREGSGGNRRENFEVWFPQSLTNGLS